VLLDIWELFDFQCGKLLAPLIRGTIAFLILEFNLSEELVGLLQSASHAAITVIEDCLIMPFYVYLRYADFDSRERLFKAESAAGKENWS
jgi:hypothetical protein